MVKINIKNSSNLRIMIAEQGMNLRSFAKNVGVSQPYLSQILNKERNPSPNVASKIANELNKEINDLFFITIDNKSETESIGS